jgi:hypothetical protein
VVGDDLSEHLNRKPKRRFQCEALSRGVPDRLQRVLHGYRGGCSWPARFLSPVRQPLRRR